MADSAFKKLVIRDIETIPEMRAVEDLQREVWGFADRDLVPVLTFIPTIEVGGVLVGAFDDNRLIGFAYGFLGRENGELILHSDMLAVMPAYRSRNIGYELKLAQRERTLADGIKTMTWTFDPLQSRNAHLNFGKLAVVSNSYRINYYGEESSSVLHRDIGTDRLWVRWELESPRVIQRLRDGQLETIQNSIPSDAVQLVRLASDGSPSAQPGELDGREYAVIEIPGDIGSLQQRDLKLVREWREVTREAFTKALAAGYVVKEFYRIDRDGQTGGAYLLSRAE